MKKFLLVISFLSISSNNIMSMDLMIRPGQQQQFMNFGPDAIFENVPMLQFAVMDDNFALAEYLIMAGANIELQNYMGENVFTYFFIKMANNLIVPDKAENFLKFLVENLTDTNVIFIDPNLKLLNDIKSLESYRPILKFLFNHPKILQFLQSDAGKKIAEQKAIKEILNDLEKDEEEKKA